VAAAGIAVAAVVAATTSTLTARNRPLLGRRIAMLFLSRACGPRPGLVARVGPLS